MVNQPTQVRHRLSSTCFPHSNIRAELGVKAMKRLMRDDTGPRGELNNDAFASALLMYCNIPITPMQPRLILAGSYVIQHHSSQERGQYIKNGDSLQKTGRKLRPRDTTPTWRR